MFGENRNNEGCEGENRSRETWDWDIWVWRNCVVRIKNH